MSDIVERLRDKHCCDNGCHCDEAAAEIERLSNANDTVWADNERLRAALRQIAGIDPWDNSEQGFVDKARAALAEEKPCSSS